MHQIQAVKARQSRNQHVDAYFGQNKNLILNEKFITAPSKTSSQIGMRFE
jgi:hypothetical protein